MIANDIVLQLRDKIPTFVDRFSTELEIVSITSAGTVATLITLENHNLSVGESFNINSLSIPSELSEFTMSQIDGFQQGGIVQAMVKTEEDHDLTFGYQTTVKISSTSPGINGVYDLIEVSNRRNFVLQSIDRPNIIGALGVTAINIGQDVFSGLKVVASVIDSKTITFNIARPTNAATINSGNISKDFRIARTLDLDRTLASYTKQKVKDDYLFVALGPVTASKDRNINSDALYIAPGGVDYKQQLTQTFTIFYFTNARSEISGAEKRDYVEEFLFPAITKSITGVKFRTGVSTSEYYKTVFDSHDVAGYDTSVYIHRFSFQSLAELNSNDTVGESENVAFRDIELELITDLMSDDTTILESKIDLDEEPLP